MSTEPVIELNAKERLARSRRALLVEFQGGRPAPPDQFDAPATSASGVGPGVRLRARREGLIAGLLSKSPWGAVAKNIVTRWWARHPANAATHLVQPMLKRYARQQPGKLMAAAAGLGVLVVIVKPWRLLSVTALVAAVLKTSDIAAMVTGLMEVRRDVRKTDR